MAARSPQIFVVSDGRGETCSQVLDASLVQFEGERRRIRRHSDVRTAAQVEAIVRQASSLHAVIFYTLVGDETRKAMTRVAREHGVPTVDILGPAFSALHDLFHRAPGRTPGVLYASDRDRFDRQ